MRKLITEAYDFIYEADKVDYDVDKHPGVLAIVTGVLGAHKTANRDYAKGVIAKGLQNENFQFKLTHRAVYGTADHPDGDEGTRIRDIANLVTEIYVDEKDDKIRGTFEVLDTPDGRIVYTLLKAKTGLGWSMRGWGDSVMENDRETVTEYEPETVDIVADPAVIATMTDREVTLLAESVKKGSSPLAEALKKDLPSDGSSENVNKLVTLLTESYAEKRKLEEKTERLIEALSSLRTEVVQLKDQLQASPSGEGEPKDELQSKLSALKTKLRKADAEEDTDMNTKELEARLKALKGKIAEADGTEFADLEERIAAVKAKLAEMDKPAGDTKTEEELAAEAATSEEAKKAAAKEAEAAAKAAKEGKAKTEEELAAEAEAKEAAEKEAAEKAAAEKPKKEEPKEEEVTLDSYKVAVLKERIFPEEVRKEILGAESADDVDKTVEAYLRSLMDKQDEGVKPVKTEEPEEKTEEQKRNAGLYSRRL